MGCRERRIAQVITDCSMPAMERIMRQVAEHGGLTKSLATIRELFEKALEDAAEAGYANGRQSGYTDGYKVGMFAGQHEGFKAGTAHGYENGRMQGYLDGFEAGKRNQG